MTQPCSTDSGLLVLVPTRDLGEGFGGRQRVLLGTERGRAQARSPGTSAGRAGRWASQHELYSPVGREAAYTTCPLGGPKYRESGRTVTCLALAQGPSLERPLLPPALWNMGKDTGESQH